MKYIIRSLLFAALALAILPGASCPSRDNPPIPRESPEKNMQVMRQALENDDYSTAYYCLSKNTRERYSFFNFKVMLEYTIFGILVKNMLINWDVKSVKYYNETIASNDPNKKPKVIEKARMILQHWKYPEYQKEFILVYEDEGWRIDLTMAHVLGVPQEDEDNLFPVRQE